MIQQPYIGITGFMNRKEIDIILRSMGSDEERFLMVGVLASEKTLLDLKNKWPNRYPKLEEIENIFYKHKQIINIIHYHTDNEYFIDELESLVIFAGEACNGIQLNITWPNPTILEFFKKSHPDKKIIFQVNGKMLSRPLKELYHRFLTDYNGLVDYILFDGSSGKGIPLDVDFLLPYFETFASVSCNNFNMVVAGGLHANNLQLLNPLIKIYPDLSVDAEGALRDRSDKLSIVKTKNYFREALKLFNPF